MMPMSIEIFSSTESDLKHTKEDGAEEEGPSVLDMSSGMELDKEREVEVTMFFGRSSIEVTAQGKNFSSGKDNILFQLPSNGFCIAHEQIAPMTNILDL